MDREALLQHVAHGLGARVPEATRTLRAVWSGLKASLPPGQVTDFERHVPKDVVALLERLSRRVRHVDGAPGAIDQRGRCRPPAAGVQGHRPDDRQDLPP
jgi:hypothetical protein